MLPALNEISAQQSKPTAHTITKCNHLLDYAAIYHKAVIQYHARDMIPHGDTDSAYLVLPKACSRIAGHSYIGDHPPPTDTPKPKLNGPILTVCQTLKNVVASAAEAEPGGVFLNRQTMVPIRNTLIAMDHPQLENGNPLKSDIKTGVGIFRPFMKPKCSKSWDMKYHWLKDRTKMGHLNTYLEWGIHNWADYFTKHHPPAYHKIMGSKYLQKIHIMANKFLHATQFVQGYVNLSTYISITLWCHQINVRVTKVLVPVIGVIGPVNLSNRTGPNFVHIIIPDR